MLRWTAAGAVTSPTTVQIRVQEHHPGRIPAGAPRPSRGMSPDEVAANIRHFTAGMRTPRTQPCTGLVLSGEGVAERADLDAQLDLARAEGIERVVLHAGGSSVPAATMSAWRGRVQTLVVPLAPGELEAAAVAIRHARDAGIEVATNTVLAPAALPRLGEVVDLLVALGQDRHTFTYPFPTGPRATTGAPPAIQAVAAVCDALGRLQARGLSAGVKGLPGCYLGPHGPDLRRTANRWYVDADHQGERALVFFPDVVAFHKGEACRFCALADRCDGFFAAYLARGDAPPLSPVAAVG